MKLVQRITFALTTVILLGFAAALTAAEPYYMVVDLGGEISSDPRAINSSGEIVGNGYQGDYFAAIRWSSTGQRSYLPTATGFESHADDINKQGQVAGNWRPVGMGYSRATLWTSGQPIELGTLYGGYSLALGINDSGRVVGKSDGRAFLWENGVMSDLGTLGGSESWADDINNLGQIVGMATISTEATRAFLRLPGGPGVPPAMIDLGTLEGHVGSRAIAINDKTEVVGDSFPNEWQQRAVLWRKGAIKDLGSLRGPSGESVAVSINNAGQVVGSSSPAGYVPECLFTGFLWQNEVMVDLNDLISPDSGWRLCSADAINDNGRIIGMGVRLGEIGTRAFLLVPLTRLISFTVSPASVPGGVSARGTVTLDRPAPPGGATIWLTNTFANPNPPAMVPQTVTVPAGSYSTDFLIPTDPVKVSVTGTITATFNEDTLSGTLTVIAPPAVAPSNLTVTFVSSSQINLKWQDNNSDETHFQIQRKTGVSGTWNMVATFIPAKTTSFADTGLAARTTYYYRVRACNSAGCSPWSNEAWATTMWVWR